MSMIDPFAPADSPAHPANWKRDQRAVQADAEQQEQPAPDGLDERLAFVVDHLAATYRAEDETTVTAATLVERAQAATPPGNAKRETWVDYYLAVVPNASEEGAPTVPNIKTETERVLAELAAALVVQPEGEVEQA